MGQMGRDERHVAEINTRVAAMWLQFLLLLITLVAAWTHVESRISKVEQRQDDAVADRDEMRQQLNRIESLLIKQAP